MSARSKNVPPEKALFQPLPATTLLGRLGREIAGLGNELAAGPLKYLDAAFLPEQVRDWFPLALLSKTGHGVAHPLDVIAGAAATDEIGLKRRRIFIPVLSVSAVLHGVLISVLVYLMFFSQFTGISVVNKSYRKFDPRQFDKLYYPAQIIRQHELDNLMKLEEIRERDKQRREEALRRQKEREEEERKAREAAEAKAKEEQAKAETAKTNSAPPKFGEINEAPIKDMVGEIYALYKAGELELGEDLNFTMMATFKIQPDGSFSNIQLVKKSPSRKVDLKALEILHMIGESHALGPLKDLTSNSIRLELNENVAKLTITSFAATADDAKAKANLLNLLFFAMRMKKNSTDVAELLSMLKVNADNKRLDAALIVPRARANEMFRNKFGGNPPQ
jgi:hypothetical protein